MRDLTPDEGLFDLIWSEGALYLMGFSEGVLNPTGFRDGCFSATVCLRQAAFGGQRTLLVEARSAIRMPTIFFDCVSRHGRGGRLFVPY